MTPPEYDSKVEGANVKNAEFQNLEWRHLAFTVTKFHT